jgi:hypothetical protein
LGRGETVIDRASAITSALVEWCGPLLVASLAVTAVLVHLRAEWSRGAWIVVGVLVASLFGAFAVSPYDVHWHLSAAVRRTTIAPRFVLVESLLLDGFAAIAKTRGLISETLSRSPPE